MEQLNLYGYEYPASPHVVSYLGEDGFIDVFGLLNARNEHYHRKRAFDEAIALESKSKRAFKPREQYSRRDPRKTAWYRDYVLDKGNTFKNPLHRDGKDFALRFSHSFKSVHEIVEKCQEPGQLPWKQKVDAVGRPAHPIELLVLGSLRILTRNHTLDDIYEATDISKSVIDVFFTRFVKWYAEKVFPETVRLPTLEELPNQCGEYAVAQMQGILKYLHSL